MTGQHVSIGGVNSCMALTQASWYWSSGETMATRGPVSTRTRTYFDLPNPFKYFLFVLKSLGAPFTQPINPASLANSYADFSLPFADRYVSNASRTTVDSRTPVVRDRSFRRRATSLGTRTEMRCDAIIVLCSCQTF